MKPGDRVHVPAGPGEIRTLVRIEGSFWYATVALDGGGFATVADERVIRPENETPKARES